MFRSFHLCGFAILATSLPFFLGCGSGEETTVAQADPQPAATSTASNEAEEEAEPSNNEEGGGESYGDESYGAEGSGGGQRSGQGYGGGEEGGMENSGYSDYSSEMNEGSGEEGGMGMMGMGSYGMSDMGDMGSDESSSMMPEGYGAAMGGMAGNESGYGGGGYGQMAGMGGGMNGATGPNFNSLAQFVKQNCVQCHGATNPKGELNLLTLSDDFVFDADGWSHVVEQLETGKMPPRNVQRRPDPTQQQMMVSYVKEQLSGSEGADQGYLVRAKHFFGAGKEQLALKLLRAHALIVDDEAAASVLSQSRWFPLGRKPVTTLRFGAGVVLDAPSTLTDLKPIGTHQFGGGGGGGAESSGGFGMVSRGGPSGGNNAGGGTERSFNDLTGDLGQALASGFQSRWASGSLGSVFNEVAEVESNATTVATAGAAGGGGYGEMGGGMGGMGGMGMGAPGLEGEGGGFGGYGGGYGGEGGGMGGGGAGPAAARKTIRVGQSITPGLVFLGTGSQIELMEKAAEAGIDGVFIFDVKASQNRRTGITNNETRIRLVMTSGSVVASTSTLVNTEVERAAMRGSDDSVEKNIERMFTRMDGEVQLTEMPPQLKAEHAKKRIHQLVNDKTISPLETMYETRLFNSLGLISQEDMATVFQILLRGNEGVVLATGAPQDRKQVMKDILAKD